MKIRTRRTVVGGAVAVAAIAGGGAAIAATHDSAPTADSTSIVSDAAGQLGISASSLTSALQKAEEDQIDSQVTAGKLTAAQGAAIKAKIAAGTVPLVGVAGLGGGGRGFGGGPGFGHGGPGGRGPGGPGDLTAAATYLGVTVSVLQTDLQGGQTLAQVATAQGKTVDGLVSALVAAEKTHLDADVTAGKITAAQETTIESTLTQRITDAVNGVHHTG
jgi:hypothetical protein